MAKPELRVSVFSDYICPFCYIGSRRLLRLGERYELRVNWCGLEIHPETPAAGMPVAKLGYEPERWNQMMVELAHLAQEERLALQAPGFTTNSRRALLLAEAAKQAGRDRFYAVHEGLFDAYFRQRKNIGDERELRRIAVGAGLAQELVDQAWASEALSERLAFNLRSARALGISGTPAFVFGRRLLVGALPLAQLEQAAAELVAAAGTRQQD